MRLLIMQTAGCEGVTGQLKAHDPMPCPHDLIFPEADPFRPFRMMVKVPGYVNFFPEMMMMTVERTT